MSLLGGNALYSALGAQFCASSVSIAATVGYDWPSDSLALLESNSIDCSMIQEHSYESLRAWIIYEQNGQRRYLLRHPEVVSHTPNPLAAEITEKQIQSFTESAKTVHSRACPDVAKYKKSLESFCAVHLCPMPLEYLVEWLDVLSSHPDIVVSLDIPPIQVNLTEESSILDSLLARVDIFMPSEAEAQFLQPNFVPEEFARVIASKGPKTVIIKMGSEGAWLYSAEEKKLVHIPPIRTKLVDVTGAGDVFCGAFIAEFARSGAPLQAAAAATSAASMTIETFDARTILTASPQELSKRQQDIMRLIDS